jgi:hypothetical protein
MSRCCAPRVGRGDRGLAITLALLVACLVPILMSVACVMIARHFYPRGSRLTPGLAGAIAATAIPLLVILTIRNTPALHSGLGTNGPWVSIVLFAASSLIAPVALIWLRIRYGKTQ